MKAYLFFGLWHMSVPFQHIKMSTAFYNILEKPQKFTFSFMAYRPVYIFYFLFMAYEDSPSTHP